VKNLCMFLMLMMLAVFNLQAGTLSATTDRAHLSARETLTLSIQYDETADDEPDTRELEQQFMILSRNKSSSIRIINGDASSTTTWHFELSPKKSGTLVIPSFTVNGDSSEAITIEVTTKPDTQASSSSQNIYTEALLDKDNVYVQQQVIATWRLVSRFNISEPQFLPPKIDGALVQDLGIRGFQRPGAMAALNGLLNSAMPFFHSKVEKLLFHHNNFRPWLIRPNAPLQVFSALAAPKSGLELMKNQLQSCLQIPGHLLTGYRLLHLKFRRKSPAPIRHNKRLQVLHLQG
jgi:hypothetical protein